jgi:hypothetical protein
MSKGYVILAEGKEYIRQAYALALSIKSTQHIINNVSLVTNDVVEDEYIRAFDKIIPIPWISKTDDSMFKVEHRWKLYHVTPYEETVVLDADMLMLSDISHFWDEFSKHDVYYTSKVYTYRGNLITDDFYRKAFTQNNLPNLYSALHYFKKREFSKEFYGWVELITNNWSLFYGKYVSESYPSQPSMDITAALAAKIMDCSNTITNYNRDPVSFVHMKPMIQGWKAPLEKWTTTVGTYYDETAQLKIGNYAQYGVFHYTENEFLTDDIINKLEKICLMI